MKVQRQIDGQPVEIEWREDGGAVEFRASRSGSASEATPQRADVLEVEPGIYSVLVDGRSYDVRLERAHYGDFAQVGPWRVRMEAVERTKVGAVGGKDGPAKVLSKMPGRVVKLLVAEGDTVSEGQGLLVLEAMKMQNEIAAPRAGAIRGLSAQEGDVVTAGALLCRVE